MIGKVRRLALALARGGPFGRQGLALAEADDATVLDALTRARPLYPRLLDQPPGAGERPFQSLADLARAAAAVERAAAAQAMLRGLGVEPRHIAPDGPLLADSGADAATLDAGLLARTVLVKRLLSPGRTAPAVAVLDPREVRAFEGQLQRGRTGPATLPAALAKRARALLDAVAPAALARRRHGRRRALDRRPGAARAGAGAQAAAAAPKRPPTRRSGGAEAKPDAPGEGRRRGQGRQAQGEGRRAQGKKARPRSRRRPGRAKARREVPARKAKVQAKARCPRASRRRPRNPPAARNPSGGDRVN